MFIFQVQSCSTLLVTDRKKGNANLSNGLKRFLTVTCFAPSYARTSYYFLGSFWKTIIEAQISVETNKSNLTLIYMKCVSKDQNTALIARDFIWKMLQNSDFMYSSIYILKIVWWHNFTVFRSKYGF